jgi:hypothetical protein
MELIRQNPYHVIGVLAGAKQRTIAKQKAKIKAFQKVGKDISFDTDLDGTGRPERSANAIEKAFSGIEINSDRLFNALFWFTNQNHLDETALSYLQAGNTDKAESIWEKITSDKEVTPRNYSAFNNLGTLKLNTAFAGSSIKSESLVKGVQLKTELLTSQYFNDFCHFVTDETYTVDPDKELELFVNAILEEADKFQVEEARKVPSIIGKVHPKVKAYLSEKLTDSPLYNIKQKTDQTKDKRNNNPKDGFQLAYKLYRDTKSDLTTLTEILGKSDLKYKMTANKLAKEILQCGIDYFKEYQDNEILHDGNLGADVMKIFKIARSIAVGAQTNERISENIQGLQEWIDSADEREKHKLISDDLEFIAEEIDLLQSIPDTVRHANEFVLKCTPKLQNIKSVLGGYDELYIKISSAIVNNALEMLVAAINSKQSDPSMKLDNLIWFVRSALKVSNRIGELDMVPELRKHYEKNHLTLKSIYYDLNNAKSRASSSSGGCYIATMAYGDYDHPQVLELRRFRDETLDNSFLGREFIKLYYWLSPKLVKILKGNIIINTLIRKILNQVIKYIK